MCGAAQRRHQAAPGLWGRSTHGGCRVDDKKLLQKRQSRIKENYFITDSEKEGTGRKIGPELRGNLGCGVVIRLFSVLSLMKGFSEISKALK